jgi:GTP-binding protein LepA
MKHIRNFCIIAHIDHGKSTLADRLLDFTGSVTDREKKEQLLDNMDLERERGITIKSHAIQMEYEHEGESYVLNLIDTPGHVDFSYEVSRSIAACEGALLVVDAAQSIQAQTISNLYLALENDLEIIPVLNKVDLPSASPEEVTDDIVDLLGCKPEEVIPASAKTGIGIKDILTAIIDRIPPPGGNVDEPLQALVFDSVYNPFRGVETYFRVINGEIKKGQKIKFVATGKTYFADEVGTLKLTQVPKPGIKAGDVGYLITGIKDAREVKVGDTITDAANPTKNAIAGFEDVKPMVFAGIYPVDTEDFEELRSSM